MDFLRANKINLLGSFWGERQKKVCREMSVRQFRILNGEIKYADDRTSHCVENFRILVGDSQGEFVGHWFADHDLFKWLEGAIYSYYYSKSEELKEIIDYVADLLQRAQGEDGYLNTYYMLKEPNKRWTNFTVGHELLCAGNLIEAATAEKFLLNEDRFLKIAIRYADYIYDTIMSSDKKIYDGHEEIEIALLKLYLLTGNAKYLSLAERFVNNRGVGECLFLTEEAYKSFCFPLTYFQAHKPVREQTEAVGHAVRAMYLYTAMAELALLKGDDALYESAKKLLENVTTKKMYLTGGIGSEHYGERFTLDYDLPNDRAYNETCAEVGLMMFCRAMLKHEPNAAIADVLEKTLYNGVLPGVSIDGKKYFYVNPLSIIPEVSDFRVDTNLTASARTEWMDCPCCPPNLFRLMAALGEYVYTYNEDNIYLNLFLSNEAEIDGKKIVVITNEPYSNVLTISFPQKIKQVYNVKIPYWSKGYQVQGTGVTYREKDRYIAVSVEGKDAQIKITFVQDATFVYGNEKIEATAFKVAVEKGYLVYCAEEVDNGKQLYQLALDENAPLICNQDGDEFETIAVKGIKKVFSNQDLYSCRRPTAEEKCIKLVPYYYWNNRGIGEMRVWLNIK